LRADRGVVLAAVQQDGRTLRHAVGACQWDEEILSVATEQGVCLSEWEDELEATSTGMVINDGLLPEISQEITYSDDYESYALLDCPDDDCCQSPTMFDASVGRESMNELMADRDFVLTVVQLVGGDAFELAATDIRADRDLVLSAVQRGGCALEYAAVEFRADREIVLAAVQQNGRALQYASQTLQANRSFILSAVQLNGLALQYVAPCFQSDRDIAFAAVQQNWRALEHTTLRLRADRELMLVAAAQDVQAIKLASPSLQLDDECPLSFSS